MQYLPDGSVVPSFLGVSNTTSPDLDTTTNPFMREGEVVEIVYPDDKRSRTKKVLEYIVEVQHTDRGTSTAKLYNCVLANPLAGLADRIHFTLRTRKPQQKGKGKSDGKYEFGSKVLIVCINGHQHDAVIISGLHDDKNQKYRNAKSKGHHFEAEFNGMLFEINKDGELTITYNGKNESNGKMSKSVDKNATGTTVKIQKNGSIRLATKDQNIVIDHQMKKLQINANTMLEINSKGPTKINSVGPIALAAPGVQLAPPTPAGGSPPTPMMKMDKGGVKIGKAGQAMVKGTAYRNAEKQMNTKLKIALQTMAIICQAPGPLKPLGPGFAQMLAAITAFEAQASQFLSTKNKID